MTIDETKWELLIFSNLSDTVHLKSVGVHVLLKRIYRQVSIVA